jgi:hypothetical protein
VHQIFALILINRKPSANFQRAKLVRAKKWRSGGIKQRDGARRMLKNG